MFINSPSVVISISTGNTDFPFGFKWYAESDIYVYLTPAGEAVELERDLLPNGSYSITANPSNIGGTVSIPTASNGDTIRIQRKLPLTRSIDYATRGSFKALTVNDDQDYQTYLVMDLFYQTEDLVTAPGGLVFPSPLPEAYLTWDANGVLVNDTIPPTWRNETEAFRDETEIFRDEAGISASSASTSATLAEESYQNTLLVEPAVIAQGDTQVARIIDEGDTQIEAVQLEGVTQISRVTNEGGIQVARVISQGDTQEARITAEGNTQAARAGVEADRAEAEADRAEANADTIKAVAVTKPVTSVPNLPSGEPGLPDVDYNAGSGEFSFAIPVGAKGDQGLPGPGFTPQGAATVADLNALTADPTPGDAWWMLDAGTVTYGSQNTVVTEPDEILVWVANGYFFNAGKLEIGSAWGSVSQVTVDGGPTANGQDLASTDYAVNKAGDTMTGDLHAPKLFTEDRVSFSDGANESYTWMDYTQLKSLGEFTIDTTALSVLAPATFTQIPKVLSAQGSDGTELTRKDYVDGELDKVVGSVTTGTVTRISSMVSCTQAEYDALTPNASTLYVIVG